MFIQEQNELREDYKIKKKLTPAQIVWRNKSSKGILFLLLFSIAVPILVYYFIMHQTKASRPEETHDTCSVEKTYRIPCGKSENVTFNYCNTIHCCFDNSTKSCFHYLPSKYYYFRDSKNKDYQKSLDLSPFQKKQSESIAISVNEPNLNTLQIILHGIEVTVESNQLSGTNYDCEINETHLYVDVYRKDSTLLLTTTKGPTIISENYWEWSFQLTEQYLFGLGQTLIDLDENSNLTKVIYANAKDHNTLPIFLAYQNGTYHGLLIRHTGPLEITVLPSKLVTLKSLAGRQILLELTVGPSLHEVIAQQDELRSNHYDVDLSMLGVHICREGSFVSLRQISDDFTKEKDGRDPFRYESDCYHENLVVALRNEQKQQNIDNAIVQITQQIIEPGYRFTLSLPPHVFVDSLLFNNTKELDVFFKVNATELYQGQYLNSKVVYPYFKHPSADEFVLNVKTELEMLLGDLWPNDIILGNNWPSDESFEMEKPSTFQYFSQDLQEAMSLTIPWNVLSGSQLQYVDHNEYASSQIEQIKKVFDPPIITAAHTFDTVQPIIIQNVDISWSNFQKSITTTLFNSIFGFPLTSFPVCGSTSTFNTTHESLCLRWYLMASTAPIFRISSDLPRRDPNSLVNLSQYAANIARQAVEFRYNLRYYFYTVLSRNEPLMRPMFYDFPDDVDGFGLVEQYMVGGSLLVAQPTLPEQSQISIYLPRGVNTWFEFWGGGAFTSNSSTDGWIRLTVVETDWFGFIPEGVVIPLVETSAEDPTIEKVKLIVALQCDVDINCKATGTLKVDSSTSFNFTSTDKELTIQATGGVDETKRFVMSEVSIYQATKDSLFIKTDETDPKNLIDIKTCTYDIDANPITITC